MIELRSKHYKFVRRDIIRKLYEKYKNSSSLVCYTSRFSICDFGFTVYTFQKHTINKTIKSRRTYVEFNPQDYHLLKNMIKLEQLYNVPLIGEGLSTWLL